MKPQPQKRPQQPQRAPARPQPKAKAPLPLIAAEVRPTHVHFACPACGRPFSMKAKYQNKKARCPCGARILIPPPGGVPRAIWMPPEEVRKKAAVQWQTEEGGKNATEIALERSPAKIAMYVGVLFAAIAGFVWWKKQDEKPANTSGPVLVDKETQPREAPPPADLAAAVAPCVLTVEALDEKNELIGRGSGFLAGPKVLATSLSVVLGASAVRARAGDGASWSATGVLGSDPASDLVIFALEGQDRPGLKLEPSGAAEPGTDVWVAAAGGKPAGRKLAKPAGALLKLNADPAAGALGAAIVNARGEALGMLGVSSAGDLAAAPVAALRKALETRAQTPVAAALALNADDPKNLAAGVKRLCAAGRGTLALTLAERASARNPADASLALLHGDTLLALDRPYAALRRFEESAAAKDSPEAHLGMGLALLATGASESALFELRAAAVGRGDDALTLAALALALARCGDAARASSMAGRVAGAAAADVRALTLAAAAAAAAKDDAGSKKAIEALEKLQPPAAVLVRARAEAALARGDAEAAAKLFEEMRAAGGGARASLGRGLALQRLGQKDAARDAFVDAAGSNPPDERGCLLAAEALDAEGQRDRALAQIQSILKTDPAHAEANAAAGRILLPHDPAKALPHLEQAARSRPASAGIALLLAKAQAAAGDDPAAEATLSGYLARRPDDEVRIALALLVAEEKPDQALELVKRVGAPSLAAAAAHVRGLAHLAAGRHADARRQFELAVSHDPASGLYRFLRAQAAEGESIHESRALWESYIAWAKKNGDDAARVAAAEKRMLERFGR